MQSTHPKQLRKQLKVFLDLAHQEPVRIERRSTANSVLLSEEEFNFMRNEIISLKERLASVVDLMESAGSQRRRRY